MEANPAGRNSVSDADRWRFRGAMRRAVDELKVFQRMCYSLPAEASDDNDESSFDDCIPPGARMMGSVRGEAGETILHLAFLLRQYEIGRFIIRLEPMMLGTLWEGAKYRGESILHVLCAQGCLPEMRLLTFMALHPPDELLCVDATATSARPAAFSQTLVLHHMSSGGARRNPNTGTQRHSLSQLAMLQEDDDGARSNCRINPHLASMSRTVVMQDVSNRAATGPKFIDYSLQRRCNLARRFL